MLFKTRAYLADIIVKHHKIHKKYPEVLSVNHPVWSFFNLPESSVYIVLTINGRDYVVTRRENFKHAVILDAKEEYMFEIPCFRHKFSPYVGFREKYHYCMVCDEVDYDIKFT